MSEYDCALDAQVEWASFWNSDEGKEMMQGMTKWASKKRADAGEFKPYELFNYADGELAVVTTALINGECYYWSSQMLDIVSAASESLPGSWTLMRQYIPAISGFFYFAKQVPVAEGVAIQGLGWTVITREPKMNVAAIHLPNEDGYMPDFNSVSLIIFVHNEEFRIPIPCRTGINVGEWMDKWKEEMRNFYLNEIKANTKFIEHEYVIMRLFASMLSFLQQKIMVPSRHYAERHTRRRIQSVRKAEPVVNVVKLRTLVHHTHQGNGDPVDWSCRWIVRGHWREQWYPSIRRNQPIWVASYIKGPEDKPLRNPGRLFAVVR